jgi:pyrroline-5-carboxylate reductase
LLAARIKTAPTRLSACTRTQESLHRLKSGLGNRAGDTQLGNGNDAAAMAENSDLLLFGCRGEDLPSMLKTVKPSKSFAEKTVVSLMAGVSSQTLREEFNRHGAPESTSIVRVIPSLGAKTMNSVSLIAKSAGVSETSWQAVEQCFKSLGEIVYVEEDMLAKSVAVSHRR